jgi:hypothetical protein
LKEQHKIWYIFSTSALRILIEENKGLMEKDKSFYELSQGRLQQTISNDDKLIALKKTRTSRNATGRCKIFS